MNNIRLCVALTFLTFLMFFMGCGNTATQKLLVDATLSPLPVGTVYTIDTLAELRDDCLDNPTTCSVVNGDCSIREAFRAAFENIAVDACPAGRNTSFRDEIYVTVVGTTTLAAGAENNNRGGDFDIGWQPLLISGPCPSKWTINAMDRDRAFHSAGGGATDDVEYHCLDIVDGCANGGDCTQSVPGSIAAGGGIYHNSSGRMRMSNITIRSSRAFRGGSGLGVCTSPGIVTDFIMTDIELTGGEGSGAIWTHTAGRWERLNIHHNTMLGPSPWGAFDIANGVQECIDCTITDNVNTTFHSGGITVRGEAAAGRRGELQMTGGTIARNTSNGKGSALMVNGGQNCTDCGWTSWCPAASGQTYGCLAVLTDVVIEDNITDSPITYPQGSGAINVNTTGLATGRVELRGNTQVRNNTDASVMPTFAPDCSGPVDLYDVASVSNTTGCVIVQH